MSVRPQPGEKLAEALGLLKGEKFDKGVAFLECPSGQGVRTNNHVERANRKLRFDEKVRYKFRSRRSVVISAKCHNFRPRDP